MKKKVIYQITRHKISKIEITSEEEERAVAEANRDFERIDKRDKRYRLRNSSLEAMTEQVGFDIADETPSPEESLIKSEGKAELRAQVRSALSCLIVPHQILSALAGSSARTLGEGTPHTELCGWVYGGLRKSL